MSQPERAGALDVAVIGMAGRFPGAASVRQLWENLCQGREGIRALTDEEVEAAGVPRHIREDPNFVKAAGVLEGVDLFDASFFGFTPREAELMLPQQRLFLECSHQALEAGGYGAEGNRGRVGVFGGMSGGGYGYDRRNSAGMALPSQESLQETIGREKDFLTTQVSYRLNLRGPSMDVQTACSTSLVAVHLACLNLLTRECDLALAGGASLSVPQTAGYLYREGGILSRDGHCRPFDARATGTVPGNGVAVVLLKRLDDALADGDWVHAVIKGSAVNNDGRQKVGFTAPSVDGQAEVIADALAAAGVAGESIGYVEAHGTGTALGDPVEVAALVKAFATARRRNCAIGALKASIGHLDAAAGVAGLIKAVMCLEHRKIPLSLHFEEPSPHIDFAESPFYVNAKTIEWQRGQSERRAAVSSFGIGGTNAHLVLEEAPPRAASAATGSSQVLVLSARSDAALDRATASLKDHLEARADLDLANVCYTLQVGRSTFPFRRAVVCRDSREAVETLASSDPRRLVSGRSQASARVAFEFPAQALSPSATEDAALRHQPRFRKETDRCRRALKELFGFDPLRGPEPGLDVRGDGRRGGADAAALDLFVREYATARLWMSLGVQPVALLGEGVGEYAAACVAETFSLEDGMTLVAEHARLASERQAGAAGDKRTLEAFRARVEATSRRPPRIPFACPRTGRLLADDLIVDPAHWTSGWSDALSTPRGLSTPWDGIRLDVGPGGTLAMAGSSSGDDVLHVALARLWSQGVEVDWSSLRANGRGQRVPLPTYPFERKRFWIGRGRDDAAPPGIGEATVGTADLADWFHMPGWRRAIPSEHLEPRLEGEWPRTWIVFLDPEGPGARMVDALLRRPGLHVIQVLAGRRFERIGEEKYVLDPGAPEHYASLLRSSNASEQPALGIVHAWAAASPEGAWESNSPPEWATKELASLSFLTQALEEEDIRSPVQVEVLTQGLFRVTGLETIWPDRAYLMGSCREMAGDRPDVTCRLFDLGPSGEQEIEVAQSASLMAEFFAAAIDPIVAYRSGQRWVPSLEPLPLRRDGGLPSRVRPGGAYVITGGLRQPGFAMARSLAEQGAGAVVFQTDASLTDADPGLLAQLRDLGAEASLVSTDLSSAPAVEDLLSGVMRRFGRLNGVIHCPVLPASGPLEGRPVPEELESFGLLVRATSTLHEALERRAADFMILCGSSDWLVSRVVEVGECALAAFLAAFTHAEAGAGLATQVVLWPRSLPPTEGSPTDLPSVGVSEAFKRVLGTRLPEVVVAPHDLRSLVEEVLTRRPRPRKSIETGDALALRAEHGRPAALAEYCPPQDEAERQIAGVWEGLFGIRPIGREDSFLDLGGNSLLAIQMISDLRKVLDIEIPLSSVFENPSVSGLARVARGLTQSAQGIERFLSDVESLSPEEAQALLTRELEGADEQ